MKALTGPGFAATRKHAEEAIAAHLEANGFGGVLTWNHLGNTLAVVSKDGFFGI